MSLSDVMGHLRLDLYAEVAIVLFFVAFAAIAINAFCRPKKELAHLASLPLQDHDDAAPRGADGSNP